METIVAIVVTSFAVLMGVAVAAAVQRSRGFRRAVRHTAESLGLELEQGGLLRSPRAHGRVDGLDVELRYVRELDRRKRKRGKDTDPVLFTRVTVTGPWRRDLLVQPRDEAAQARRGLLESINAAVSNAREVRTGDPHLDDAVIVKATNRYDTLSRLGADSRAYLRVLIGDQGGEVRDRTLTLKRRQLVTDPELLEGMTRAALSLGRGLSRDGDSAETALAAIVRDDPVDTVRVNALTELVTEAPLHPETKSAIAAALAPGDPALRILAATHAGEDGFDAARDVALQHDAPVPARRAALELLGSRYPRRRDEAAATLDDALASLDDALLGVALDATGALEHRSGLDRLAGVAPRVGARSSRAYAEALTRHGPASEGLLLGLLAVDHTDTRVVAARALGQVGSVGAVPLLTEHTSGVFKSRTLKSTAREAIAAIRPAAAKGRWAG